VLAEELDGFVWPRRVADEVAQVVGGVDAALSHVREHRFERRKVGMNVCDESVFHVGISFLRPGIPDSSGHERTGFDTVLVAKVVASPTTKPHTLP